MQISGIAGAGSAPHWYMNKSDAIKSGSSGKEDVLQSQIETLQTRLEKLQQESDPTSKETQQEQQDLRDQIETLQTQLTEVQKTDGAKEKDAGTEKAAPLSGEVRDRLDISKQGRQLALSTAVMQGLAAADSAQETGEASEQAAQGIETQANEVKGQIAMAKAQDADTSADTAALNDLTEQAATVRADGMKKMSRSAEQLKSATQGEKPDVTQETDDAPTAASQTPDDAAAETAETASTGTEIVG
jgi:hypothetical protein